VSRNHIYFIGAGPGEPDLLTVRGATLLERCGAVFVVPPYEMTFSRILAGKDIYIPFAYDFANLVSTIKERLLLTDVAFLIPGDLALFSPFQALIDTLGDDAEVVPGIGILNAASARVRKSFNLSVSCTRTVVLSPRLLVGKSESCNLRNFAGEGVTLVIYMNDLPAAELASQLRSGYGKNIPVAVFHRLGLPGEIVLQGSLDDLERARGNWAFLEMGKVEGKSSLTLIVVGESLDAVLNGRWWDQKRKESWQTQYQNYAPIRWDQEDV